MSFPSSPTDGQIFGKFYFDQTVGAWLRFGDLDVKGDLDVTGDADVTGTLDVTGTATFNEVVLGTTPSSLNNSIWVAAIV